MDDLREEFPGRAEMIAYAEKHEFPVQASTKKPYSMDRNLLHISFEAGMLEDVWFDSTAKNCRDMYKLRVPPEGAPDKPEYVQLLFEKGNRIGLQASGIAAMVKKFKLKSSGAKDGYTLLTPSGIMKVLNALGGPHAAPLMPARYAPEQKG